MRRATARERGNISVIGLAGVGLALVLCLGIARVGGAVVLQSRADTAADAAALAGADALALGEQPRIANEAAAAAAADNGANLVSCTCAGEVAEVVVGIGRAHGHARAVLDGARRAEIRPAPERAP